MINDENFSALLDTAYKKQRIKKDDREHYIKHALLRPVNERDELLNRAEVLANAAQAERKKKCKSEAEEQIEFVRWLRQDRGLTPVQIRNDGTRTPRERAEQLCLGLHPGAADLLVLEAHCFVEMKRANGSERDLSTKQLEFRDLAIASGYQWIVAFGAEDAKRKINVLTIE